MELDNKPGEPARLHKALIDAFRAHWKSHDGKHPQKIIMPPAHERALAGYLNSKYDPPGTYWGVPIEIDPNSPGVLIAIDGTEMPFADFDPAKKA